MLFKFFYKFCTVPLKKINRIIENLPIEVVKVDKPYKSVLQNQLFHPIHFKIIQFCPEYHKQRLYFSYQIHFHLNFLNLTEIYYSKFFWHLYPPSQKL